MKIPMMQSIEAMRKKPEFEYIYSVNSVAIKNKAVAIRLKCLELIRGGERCLTALSKQLGVHRVTVRVYLKELADNGLIELVIGTGVKAQIVNVL